MKKPGVVVLLFLATFTFSMGAPTDDDSATSESQESAQVVEATSASGTTTSDSSQPPDEGQTKKVTEKRAPVHMTAVPGMAGPNQIQSAFKLAFDLPSPKSAFGSFLTVGQPFKASHPAPLQYLPMSTPQVTPMLLLMHPSGQFMFLVPLPPQHHQQPLYNYVPQFYPTPQFTAPASPFYYPQKMFSPQVAPYQHRQLVAQAPAAFSPQQQLVYSSSAFSQGPDSSQASPSSSSSKSSNSVSGEQYIKG